MKRFFRWISLLPALMMLVMSFSSCSLVYDTIVNGLFETHEKGIPENNEKDYVEIDGMNYSVSEYYTPISSRYSYDLLSEGEQALYDGLRENAFFIYPDADDTGLYKTKQVILDEVQLTEAQIRSAMKALYDDEPYLYWLSYTFLMLVEKEENYTAVQLYSEYPPDTVNEQLAEMDTVLDDFFTFIPGELSAYERELFAHDYLIDTCEYDEESAKAEPDEKINPGSGDAYGALVDGKAVCEGYARAFQLLLNGIGVDCVGVTGIGFAPDEEDDEVLHMWNAVKLDDSWYYVDTTWDDGDHEISRYDYLNLDENIMSLDHTPSKVLSELSEDEINGEETYSTLAMNIFIPECTSMEYNYYVMECPHLRDYDGEEVKDALYQAALEGQDYFTFYIEPDSLDFDSSIKVLFKELPQYFFSYVDEVNDMLYSYEIDNENLTYYADEHLHNVAVELNYY